MSEYPESLDRALESQLKTLAPGVPGELEVERMAARARQATTAGARTSWRSWQLATTVATLVVFVGGLALVEGLGGIGHRVPASSTTSSTHATPSRPSAVSSSSAQSHPTNMRLAYPGTDIRGPAFAPNLIGPSGMEYSPTRVLRFPYSEFQFINRGAFNSHNFGRLTAKDLEKRYGITLSFPPKAAGGNYQGILQQADSGGNAAYSAIYSNDTMMDIHVLPSIHDAEGSIGGTTRSLAAYVTTHTIGGGVIAYATPKLTRVPIVDSKGHMVFEGTLNARVTWRRGRFVISVASPNGSVDELLGVARGVTFELTSTAK